jgi:hypothetical protein
MILPCNPAATHGTRKRLSGLQPVYFQHPLDKVETENLAKVKWIDLFIKKIHGALGWRRSFSPRTSVDA